MEEAVEEPVPEMLATIAFGPDCSLNIKQLVPNPIAFEGATGASMQLRELTRHMFPEEEAFSCAVESPSAASLAAPEAPPLKVRKYQHVYK